MTTRTIYYPRAKSINFYDTFGNITGGIRGSLARKKFIRLLKSGCLARISLRKNVKYSI